MEAKKEASSFQHWKKNGDSSPDGSQARPRVALASNQEPTYYIGGGNGNAVVEEVMNNLGWKRVRDKSDDTIRLRWCELKSTINYTAFKEGEQMVNRIPNGSLLTNKLGLLNSLQEYAKRRSVKLDFLPETYRIDERKDRDTFTEVFKEDEIWICKPTGRNQGKGIFLVRSLLHLQQADAENDEQNAKQKPQKKPMSRIIQRYIMNPLLLDNRKFDIRCYMLVASAMPLLVLYRRGYCRLSMHEYDNSSENIIAHLTNQFIQKRDPKYSEVKEDTAWSMERFNEYINENVAPNKDLAQDWVFGHLDTTIRQIMLHCVHAVKSKLQCKVGYFDLYGFDFMIDEEMKIWLIEINVNPCLATNCGALKEAVPEVVRESIHLAIECFEKARRGRPLKPLQSLKDFRIIYEGSGKSSSDGKGEKSQMTQDRTKFQSPVRRARSLSPVKESTAITAQRDSTQRGKASTTGIPKSVSLNPVQTVQSNGPGKEKRQSQVQENAGVKSDAAKPGLETTSATRIRQGRRTAKDVSGTPSDAKADENGTSADETTKPATQRTAQSDQIRGKTAPTSTKPAANGLRQKEPQSQKKRVVIADSSDDNPSMPSRGS